MSRTWSIERRLLAWITGSVATLSLLYGAAAAWGISATLRHELDVLGIEEIEEFEAETRERQLDPSELEALLRAIADDHPAYYFSWQLWRTEPEEVWRTFGRAPRLELPSSWVAALAAERAPDDITRWHTTEVQVSLDAEPTPSPLRVGLLLDATPRRRTARNAMLYLLGAIALTAVVASVGASFLTRRVARTLRDAASLARDLDRVRVSGDLTVRDAPVEVQAVADAFEHSLTALRTQHARNLLLTAGMAHELRSPLHNMMSEVSVARMRDRSSSEYRAVLDSLLDEMRDIGRVVDNLITLTALREPGALDRTETLSLETEVELRLAKEVARAESSGVTLSIRCEGPLIMQGDREALVLMLRNLIDNAIRCVGDAGRVDVHLFANADAIVLRVDDDGPGVPADLRESIFRAFEQAPTHAGRRGGFGLGLALARAAAEAHGGSLELTESPLGGARFEAQLPLTPPESPTAT